MVSDAAGRSRCRHEPRVHRTHRFADIGHLVHKGNLGGQHAVGRVLGHLRTANAHDNHLVAAAGKWGIQRFQQLGRSHVVRTNDHPVGLQEIIDRVALLRNSGFETTSNSTVTLFAEPGINYAFDPVGCAHRHGGFVDDDLVVGDKLPDLGGHLVHKGQVA